MNTFPLFHKLENQPVIIIGGGDVAMRKADLLRRARACLTIVAPHIDDELKVLLSKEDSVTKGASDDAQRPIFHTLIEQDYEKTHLLLDGFVFAIVATDDERLNKQIHADCKSLGMLVNVVDTPPLCDFIFPAIVDRNPITIGISSNGKAPVLARLLRAKIETIIPQQYGKLAKIAGDFRGEVKAKLPTINARRKFWEHAFTGKYSEQVFAGNDSLAQSQLEQDLDTFSQLYANNSIKQTQLQDGEVYIVGAGAGDPELLTFKALRLMQQADIVFYDALVSPEILDLCRRDSDKIYVGKKRCQHAVKQENINELLVTHAKMGKRVVRLKGGDPFVFGRGAEEAQELVKQGVRFQVVPGITAATAAASHTGIPLTHRDHARSVRFVTGCLKTGTPNEQFSSMLEPNETIVFYMALNALERLTTGLVQAGKPSDTPIAIVSNAGRSNQQVLTGTLDNIVKKQQTAQLPTPALLIMGEVVNLHEELAWYHKTATTHNNSTDIDTNHTPNSGYGRSDNHQSTKQESMKQESTNDENTRNRQVRLTV